MRIPVSMARNKIEIAAIIVGLWIFWLTVFGGIAFLIIQFFLGR